jgi:hypothetical protein
MIGDLDLVNAALAMLGSSALSNLDSDDPKARACVVALNQARAQAFAGNYRWTFAKRTRQLQRIDGKPDNGFAFWFDMPADAIGGPIAILLDPRSPTSELRDYSFEDGRVTADYEILWCIYATHGDPDNWPPLFRSTFETILASLLSIPLGHDAQLAEFYRVQAFGNVQEQRRGGLIGACLAEDASRAPLGQLDIGSFRE